MKIVCISDTHNVYHPSDLPDGDMLIHAGDLSGTGRVDEIQHALAWLRRFPHKYKIFIGGNHDGALEKSVFDFKEQLKPHKDSSPLIYMCDEMIKVEGLRIYSGTSVVYDSGYNKWALAFTSSNYSMMKHWEDAPECDILITHCPPAGKLDGALERGNTHLSSYLLRCNKPPLLHVFGHVHIGHGRNDDGETTFVNAALLKEDYRSTNEPIVVEI